MKLNQALSLTAADWDARTVTLRAVAAEVPEMAPWPVLGAAPLLPGADFPFLGNQRELAACRRRLDGLLAYLR